MMYQASSSEGDGFPMLPSCWDPAMKPDAHTTPLARFHKNTNISAFAAQPVANVIYQARCAITSTRICSPVQLSLSSEGSCLALLSAGGWKDRCSVLDFWRLSGDDGADFLDSQNIEVGLGDIMRYL